MDESVPAIEFEKYVKFSLKLVTRLNLLGLESLCFTMNSFMNTNTEKEENQSVIKISLVNEDRFDDYFDFPITSENETTEIV
ncbi:hypothetical protein Syun_006682 [Stephania yunnanensis]|uniref:Uncharacterized protein n=1 Tax=Stephania yunnanensis TaxID=152371 RepID=A0AAP0KX75_9MAGN